MRAWIYDRAILPLTTKWYAEVLGRLPAKARLLDVGIGTGSALVRNKALLEEKDIRVVGVDIDKDYVEKARAQVAEHGLAGRVDVQLQSIYDHHGGPYDAAYFSASFMLMPDPPAVLRHVQTLLAPGGRIYFTQTFQDKKSALMEKAKPLLGKVTTIEFGRVTYEEDFRKTVDDGGVSLVDLVTMDTSGSRSYRLAVGVPKGAA